jgi:hypothetical protein
LSLAVGIGILPYFVPRYSQIRQTVSEIGEVGSPAQTALALMLLSGWRSAPSRIHSIMYLALPS